MAVGHRKTAANEIAALRRQVTRQRAEHRAELRAMQDRVATVCQHTITLCHHVERLVNEKETLAKLVSVPPELQR